MKDMKKKRISIIVPLLNEAKNLPLLMKELQKQFVSLKKYSFEIILVDDGSNDETVALLQLISRRRRSVKVLHLSRNFGKEIATSCGLHHSTGDAAIIMDADLQHPPRLIKKMIEYWENGYDVIYTVRKHSKGVTLFKRFCSYLYYRLMNLISEIKIESGSTDFRLLDKKVVEAFNHLTERSRFFRGMIDWLGFSRKKIEFQAPARKKGQPQYSFKKLFRLAVNSITAFSLVPLRIAGYVGLIITCACFGLLMYMFYTRYYVDPKMFSSLAYVAVSNTLLIGIVLSCLGLIAIYVGKIHHETVNRPLYIVREKINFSKK